MQSELLEMVFDISLKVRLLRTWESARAARTSEFSERELLCLEITEEFGPLTETELGKIFGLATSSVSELVRKLSEKGVIERQGKSEGDARQRPLKLTHSGKDVLRAIKRSSAERYEYLFAGLDEADSKSLRSVIGKVKDAVTKRLKVQIFNDYS